MKILQIAIAARSSNFAIEEYAMLFGTGHEVYSTYAVYVAPTIKSSNRFFCKKIWKVFNVFNRHSIGVF